MIVNFLSREIAFNALDSMQYLREKGGSEEIYTAFISELEKGIDRIKKGDMGQISKSVIYGAMDIAYPFIEPFSDQMRLSLIGAIPNRLRYHLEQGGFHQEEINNLANFCKAFHDISLKRRSENIPRVEKLLGDLE
jgi:hypothetical protein